MRGLATGEWWTSTRLDRAIIAIGLMTAVSLYASVDLSLSMPKFYGILLGIFVYYATVRSISTKRRFWIGVVLVVASVGFVSTLGVLGTDWNTGKYPLLQRIYELAPRMIRGVETSFGRASGFQPNEVGGTLAFLLPLPLVLLFRAQLRRSHRVILAALALMGLSVLALTVSRSAFLALAAVAIPIAVWSWRRTALVALIVAAAAALVIYGYGLLSPGDFLMEIDVSNRAYANGTLTTRQEMWNRGWLMVQSFPFTGIGLNTYPKVLDTLYPSFLAGSDAQIPHAHNIYLQTAVDLGLGGLLSFLGLFAGVFVAGWRTARQTVGHDDKNLVLAVVGLLAGIGAYLVFGLTDAITLGAKPMVALWVMVGLVVAAQRITQPHVEKAAAWPTDQPDPYGKAIDVFRPVRSLALSQFERKWLRWAQTVYWLIAYLLVILAYCVVALAIFAR